ncbi:MAG: glycosyltransferase family 4 protein [Chloroflexota bacterium]
MRIGIDLACWANNRGYGRYTRNLIRALLATDRSHDYLGFGDHATLQANTFPTGLELVAVALSEAPAQAAASDGRRRAIDLWRMARAVQRAKLDVVFFPSSYTYFPVLGHARAVVVVHDAIAERMPQLIFPNRAGRLAWTLKTRLACWQAQRVVTVSQAAAGAIEQHLPIAHSRIRIIPEAADPIFGPPAQDVVARTRLAALRKRFGIPPEAQIVLYVGGFGPHKNVGTLIEAFSRLVSSVELPLHLVLVGQSVGEVFHSEVGALQEQLRRQSLGDRVTFTGFVPDSELVDWYHAAACLVLPSRDEGFGLPVAEAMACGTPVVASRVGALMEMVGDDAGLLFDPDRPEQLVAALMRLVSGDEAVQRQLSVAGLRRAATFSWEKAALALRAIFDELDPHQSLALETS